MLRLLLRARADSFRDRRPTADYRMGIHPQLANVNLAVYGDLAVRSRSVETLFSIKAQTHNKRSGVWVWAYRENGPGPGRAKPI